MKRTYWIRYRCVDGEEKFDKITYKDVEDRPSWHKAGALTEWKKSHRGYWWLRTDSVFTKTELKEYLGG